MNIIKRSILRMLIYGKIYPHIFFSFNPFKIYEFNELQKGFKFSGNEVILDIGCGTGLQTMLIGQRCSKVIGIDISEEKIRNAKYIANYMKRGVNSEFRCVKIEDAKFENEFFDYIYSICVLEHISNYDVVLREAYRILKKGGRLILSVDALENIEDNELLEKHKKEHFVEKYFKNEELKTILEQIGFKRIDIYPIFKSDYAKKLFVRGINNKFRYGFLSSILKFILLKYKEQQNSAGDKGIFLIAKCEK